MAPSSSPCCCFTGESVLRGKPRSRPAKAGPLRDKLYEGCPEFRQAYARLLMDEVRVTDDDIRRYPHQRAENPFWRDAELKGSPNLCQKVSLFVQEWRARRDFELPTPRFVVWCSIQLSYGRTYHFREVDKGCRRKRLGASNLFCGRRQERICGAGKSGFPGLAAGRLWKPTARGDPHPSQFLMIRQSLRLLDPTSSAAGGRSGRPGRRPQRAEKKG